MKKIIFFLIQLMIFTTSLFAKQNIDEAIDVAGLDIMEKCSRKSILIIDDFQSPSDKMTSYIRNQFTDFFVSKDIRVVTREDENINRLLKEQRFQNNSGMVDEQTMVSIAKIAGANSIVFGNFEDTNSECKIRLSMMDVETGFIIFSGRYDFSHDKTTYSLLDRYKKSGLGIGAELNKNSLDFIASAGSISFDYNVSKKFSLGLKMIASWDKNEKDKAFVILEPLAFLRVYLVSPPNDPATGMFIEGLGGASIFLNDSVGRTVVVNAGGSLGYRFAFGNFYIEPSFRAGYPYIFGVGLSTGLRF